MTTDLNDELLDAYWRDGLHEFVPPAASSNARPRVARRVSRRRKQRVVTSALGCVIAVLVAVAVVGAARSSGSGRGSVVVPGGGPGVAPDKRPATRVDVAALPTLTLSVTHSVVAAGNVEIHFVTRGGTHALRIEGVRSFRLVAVRIDDPSVATVKLKPGRYLLYCPIPGHRAAGEQAVLTVTAPDRTTTRATTTDRAGARNAGPPDKASRVVRVDLADIPNGVSKRTLRGTRVFLVRRANQVSVLLTDVHHLGVHRLRWCQRPRYFSGTRYGELFDVDGVVIGGPARSGLDRLSSRTARGVVSVDLDHKIPGPPRGTPTTAAGQWAARSRGCGPGLIQG